jgi:acyl carrier protein
MTEQVSIKLTRNEIAAMMNAVIAAHGQAAEPNESDDLGGIGFRSLDFSELALRVEDGIGRELNFDAVGLRSIRTVGDVLDLLEGLQAQ